MNKPFQLQSDYKPAGDQPEAIEALVEGLKAGESRSEERRVGKECRSRGSPDH